MTRWMRSPRIPAALRHWINTLRAALREWSRPHTEDLARRTLLGRSEPRRSFVPQLERLEEIEAPVSLITPAVPLGAVGHIAEASNQMPVLLSHAADTGSVDTLPSEQDTTLTDALFSQPAASSDRLAFREFVTGADQFSASQESAEHSGLMDPATAALNALVDPLSQGAQGVRNGHQGAKPPVVNNSNSAPWVLAAVLAGAGQGPGGVSTPAAVGGGASSSGGGGGSAANQLTALGIQGAFDNLAHTVSAAHQATPAHAAPVATTHTATAAPVVSPTAGATPNFGMFDEYTWSPTDPSLNASLAWDWKKNGTQQTKGTPGITTPTANDQVVFDANVSNANINWDQGFNIGSMVLGPTGGGAYTGTQSIAAGATVELNGTNFNNTSLIVDQNASVLHLNFGDKSGFQIDANATITNMNLDGLTTGTFDLNGGTTTIAQGNYTDLIGAQFLIGANATLNDQGYCPITFADSNLSLQDFGTMYVFYGPNNGITLINQGQLTTGCFIDVEGGKLTYLAKLGTTDTFAVPVRVDLGGTFALEGYTSSSLGGKLIVQGTSDAQKGTGSYSVAMLANGSSIQLSQQTTLECDSGYYQSNGTMETMDGWPSVLQAAPDSSGKAEIDGGAVIVAAQGTDFGSLTMNCGTVNFAANLTVGVRGDTSFKNDQLIVNGNLNIQAGSSLTVQIYGPAVAGKQWIIIDKAKNQLAAFPVGSVTYVNPQGVNYNASPNQPGNGQYQVSC